MTNDWIPHAKQVAALQRPEYEVLFGGARGGGKTDTGLIWLIGERYEGDKRLLEHPRYRALVIRKNAEDLADWIDRAYRLYKNYGVDIAYKPAVLRFPSGAVIRTGHLKDEQSYTKYMGQEFPRILLEELTQIAFEKRYLQLIASCRSTIPEIKPQIFATTNPGGLGHGWVKKRFVDPSPPSVPFKDSASGRSRIFIPATVEDNPTIMQADPDYVKMLDSLKDIDEALWKAWRLGDWDTFAGQFFKEFRRDLHVCKPFIPIKTNVLVGGLDWGYNAPFCFSVSEVSRVVMSDGVKFFRVKTFLEVYGTGKTPKEWADEIKKKLKGFNLTLEDIAWIQADPAIFNKGTDGSVSIRDQFIKADDKFYNLKPASNDRIPGWAQMHSWLSIAPDGLPYWQLGENCTNGISEIGAAVYNENKIEDLEGEFDHFLDQERYKLKALKWIDAGKSGGVAQLNPNSARRAIAPRYIGDKQVSVNIDAFANPNQPSGSGVGGVRH